MKPSTRLAVASAVVLLFPWGASSVGRAGSITSLSASTKQLQLPEIQLPEGVPEIDQAIESFKKSDYDQCFMLLRAAEASHPDLLPPRLLFAKLCLLLDQPAMGRAALEQAAVESPALPETYLVFGRLALQDNHLTDAQLQFDKAMALASSGAWGVHQKRAFLLDAHAGLAEVAERRKDWPAAMANLTAWLKLEPNKGQARQRLAATLFRLGQREKAHAELEHAVKDDPTLEPAAILMGQLFAEEGNPTKAAEWMEYAIKLAPDEPRAHLGYAAWLLEHDQLQQAKAQGEIAARLDPSSTEAKGLRGLIAWHMKDYQAAERIFQELHLETPGNLAASNLWALSLAEQPTDAKRSRAWQVAQINAQLYANSPEALTTLGWVAYRLGKLAQAEQTLRAAIATGKGSSETAYYLARVLADRRKDGEVQQLLKMSLGAPGHFAFRNDAQAWLDRLQKAGGQNTQKAASN
jgi:tetratricopeptide (TPR) repeat protein